MTVTRARARSAEATEDGVASSSHPRARRRRRGPIEKGEQQAAGKDDSLPPSSSTTATPPSASSSSASSSSTGPNINTLVASPDRTYRIVTSEPGYSSKRPRSNMMNISRSQYAPLTSTTHQTASSMPKAASSIDSESSTRSASSSPRSYFDKRTFSASHPASAPSSEASCSYTTATESESENGGDALHITSKSGFSSLKLPLHLPRPQSVQSLDLSKLQLDDDLQGVPMEYILDRLSLEGLDFLQTVTRTVLPALSADSVLPHSLAVRHASSSSSSCAYDNRGPTVARPDCILAISSDDEPRTLLLPVHGLVMATNTKSLSVLSKAVPLPSSRDEEDDEGDSDMESAASDIADDARSDRLPVVSLALPSSAAFAKLVPYFYTHSASSLLASLLPLDALPTLAPRQYHPTSPSSSTPSSPSLDLLLSDSPKVLATRLSVLDEHILLAHADALHSVWQTAVALGAARDGLWKTLDVAWAVLIGALAIKEARKLP